MGILRRMGRSLAWALLTVTAMATTGVSSGAGLPVSPLTCTFKGSITYTYSSGGPGSDWYDYQLDARGSGSCISVDGAHPARPPKYQASTFHFFGAMDPLARDSGPRNPFPLNTCPDLGPVGFLGTITAGGTEFGEWLNSIYDYPGIRGEMPFEVVDHFGGTTGYAVISTRIAGMCAPAQVPSSGGGWTDKIALTLTAPLQNF